MADAATEPTQFARPYELALLRAALLEGSEAEDAARTWLAYHRDASGFDRLESGSRRLLPLAYRNAKALIPAGLRVELRRIQLEYWAANQKLFRDLENLLAWFHSNGIPTLVLKGMALSILHYRDMAVRPASDLDILVPEKHARDAINRLRRGGWANDYFFADASKNDYFLHHVHGISFKHSGYSDLDLHWHVLYDATSADVDRPFWKDSVPLKVNSITSRALNPTDQLLHACMHGYAANVDVAPIRWIADSVTILRTGPVDWARLLTLSRELHATVPMHATLAFLRASFSAPIPEEVTDKLASVRVGAAERLYFHRLARAEIDWRGITADNLERHRRANRNRNLILRVASLPRQFQLHYNLPRLRDLGPFLLSQLGKRVGKRLGQL
jgi:Uncharacterised nucleotidyltransferase